VDNRLRLVDSVLHPKRVMVDSVAFSPELGIERMLRDSVPSTLFSGTSEIQRDLIALELGL